MLRPIIPFLLIVLPAIAAPHKARSIPSGWPWDVIPHVVDGGTWSTELILVNLGDAPSKYKVDFRGDDGKARVFEIVGRGQVSTVSGTLPFKGSTILKTSGTSQALNQGWANLDILGTDQIGLMAIFRQRVAGRPDYEATVLASTSVDTNAILPFDNTSGFVTAIAILNPVDYLESIIPINFFDEQGNSLGSETLRLPAGNKLEFVTSDRWSTLSGKKGTIEFGDGLYGLSVLGFRFSPTGPFTTIALMDR